MNDAHQQRLERAILIFRQYWINLPDGPEKTKAMQLGLSLNALRSGSQNQKLDMARLDRAKDN